MHGRSVSIRCYSTHWYSKNTSHPLLRYIGSTHGRRNDTIDNKLRKEGFEPFVSIYAKKTAELYSGLSETVAKLAKDKKIEGVRIVPCYLADMGRSYVSDRNPKDVGIHSVESNSHTIYVKRSK
jgi:hypothetical protein